jgi:hypothetical protein
MKIFQRKVLCAMGNKNGNDWLLEVVNIKFVKIIYNVGIDF